jgi:uncharacterized RDD family membrane protein YckC
MFWLLSPASIIWALFYYGITLGSPASATIGMRSMELELRTWYGAPCYFVLGAVHAVVYWISISVLSPVILLVGLFNARRRLLHDVLVGTVVINNAGRVASLRAGDAGFRS